MYSLFNLCSKYIQAVDAMIAIINLPQTSEVTIHHNLAVTFIIQFTVVRL